MGSRVYFAVFGSGLGHITRVIEISERLGDGYQSLFSSSGQGLRHLNARGREIAAVESPSLDVQWKEGGFSSWHVLPQFPFTFNAFLKQLAFERQSIRSFDPKVVVSDSRLSPVIAAKELSIPVVTILNQFQVSFPPRFRTRSGRFLERVGGDCLGLLWSLSDRILMTDLPPPYTIAEINLLESDISGVVEFVGFTSPRHEVTGEALQKAQRLLELDGRPLVFCQISGPDQTKGTFAATLLRAAEGLTRDFNVVVSMGYSSGSSSPRRLESGAWVFDWCPVKDELFELADVIVARAGHSTIGQCINRGKVAVLVPIHNHPEQIGNADKFSRLGLGRSIRSERLTAESLAEAVRECHGDPRYRSRIETVRELSKKYDGLEKTAEIVRSYC
jgi:UDP-N-acetylglucosamine--N-acetylmuramyl-(pentapeptide) pyrophosphoryl-undecaprenol N-acetylglucosamine transferase